MTSITSMLVVDLAEHTDGVNAGHWVGDLAEHTDGVNAGHWLPIKWIRAPGKPSVSPDSLFLTWPDLIVGGLPDSFLVCHIHNHSGS